MEDLLLAFSEIRADIPWKNLLLGFVVILLGQILIKILDWILHHVIPDLKDKHRALSVRKFSIYFANILLGILFLKVLRVEMKVILGATGLLTLAVGFAARTPISNLISGIFLVFERPFVVGDTIEVNEFQGEVLSLNLLSLTMRTLDNLMVRIPNELVIGTAVRNISFFPIRRLDLTYTIPRSESLTTFQETFKKVAERSPLALDEPEATFNVSEFKENSVEIALTVWAPSSDFSLFKTNFPKDLHRAVKKSGVEPVRTYVEIINNEKNKEVSS